MRTNLKTAVALATALGLTILACSNDSSQQGSTCADGELMCNGVCVEAMTDVANCGACGAACVGAQLCSAGVCSLTCSPGTTTCGTSCSDVKVDPQNCGSCGNACGVGQICTAGSCVDQCPSSAQTVCATDAGVSCVATKSDSANCGSCGNVCPPGEICSGGTCANTCGAGETLCPPSGDAGAAYCAPTQTDQANCGTCGKVCATGLVCSGGTCQGQCAPPYTLCGTQCVDTTIDTDNCGGCGKAVCTSPKPYCIAGVCSNSTHNIATLSYDYSGGTGGCGDFSIWYTENFGTMTYDQCETLANKYGAQYVGQPTIYAYSAPYASYVRWVGEADTTHGYIGTGSWATATSVLKSTSQYCVLGYANSSSRGSGTLSTSWASANGKTYMVNDYGVISEKTCYSNANAVGGRPLNPWMFASATKTTAHMVENHSCHGSIEYTGLGTYTIDGGANHTYRCLIGYNP